MRKISKSRADDDVVSSTNGSIANDDQSEAVGRQNDPNEKNKESDSNENNKNAEWDSDNNKDSKSDSNDLNDEEYASTTKVSMKKRNPKNKTKKRKSQKDKNITEEEYEVEKIVDSKKIKGKLHYLIRWKGYEADSDTWEPENTLSCPELINKYNEEKENSKNKDAKSGKKTIKRKAKNTIKTVPAKKTKNDWDAKHNDETVEYEVDRILEVRQKKNGKREFFIHWKGWSSKFDSWEPESNLNCPELIEKFMEKVSKARSVDVRNLRVAPVTTNRYTLQDPSSGRRLSKRCGQRQRVRYDNAE